MHGRRCTCDAALCAHAIWHPLQEHVKRSLVLAGFADSTASGSTVTCLAPAYAVGDKAAISLKRKPVAAAAATAAAPAAASAAAWSINPDDAGERLHSLWRVFRLRSTQALLKPARSLCSSRHAA